MTPTTSPAFKGSRILAAFTAQRQAERRGTTIKVVRGYDAARQDHLTMAWTGSSASINEDVKRALEIVRRRSRDLAYNNDYMKRFLRMVEVNVVGPHGFRYKNLAADPAPKIGEPAAPDEAARNLVEDHYTRWSARGVCDVTGKMSRKQVVKMLTRAMARDGEYLARRVRGAAAGNAYRYALQVLDIDRLDVNLNEELDDGHRIIMGVEVNAVGRPVAYHLLTTHPGDSYTARNGQRYERVPANQILHGGIAERAEQVRFMPWAHTAMLRLEMLGKFQTAAVVAARKGAETLGVIQQKEDAGAGPGLGQTDPATGENYETSLPGQYDTLPPGYELKPYETKYPDQIFGTFVKDCLRGASSGLLVAYHALGNDLEGVNYSSIRAGELTDRDCWMDLQAFVIESIEDVVHADWLEMALLAGAITYPTGAALPASKLEKFAAHEFTGRRWKWVDPKNDAQANQLAVERGWTTDSQVAADNGEDWYDNIVERAREQAHAKANGVTIGSPKKPAPARDPDEEPAS